MLLMRKTSPDRMVVPSAPKRQKLPTGSSRTLRLEGPPGHESLVEIIYPCGTITVHEGPKGEERKVAATFPNGDRAIYVGEQGAEQLMRIERVEKKRVDIYEGSHGNEALRRTEREDGRVCYWGGEPCCEHKLRTTYRRGGMKVYAGARRDERVVVYQAPDDTFMHYQGKRGEEQPWLKVMDDGTAQVLSTSTGRVTHSLLNDGKVLFHSRNGERSTYTTAGDFQKLKRKISDAFVEIGDLHDGSHCNEQCMKRVAESLKQIHDAADKCFVAHEGRQYDPGAIGAISDVETEEEELSNRDCVEDGTIPTNSEASDNEGDFPADS